MRFLSRPCLWMLALVLSGLLPGAEARAEHDLTPEETTYLRNHGPVVFVSQSQYAPFEFIRDNGNRDGMCIELARWIATEFGFQASFVDTSFARAQEMVQTGRADVLTSFFYSEKRDRQFDFTQTMFRIPATIFVSAERPDIGGLKDLDGKTLAIQEGDYAEDFLRGQGINFSVLRTRNFTEATDRVIAGDADAVIGDEQIVLYYLYSHDLEDALKKVGEPLYTGENAMAVIDGNRILAGILNKGIALARERGVLQSIHEKWLGARLSSSESLLFAYRWWLGSVAAVFLGMLIAIWLWSLSLRRLVLRRTRTLRENERFLDTVIDNLPNMLFIKDAQDLRFIKFNRAGEELIGYQRETLLGKNDYDFFPGAQADRFVERDREVLASGRLEDIPEEEILTRHGGVRKLHTQKIPIYDGQGRPKYLLGISEDITDRLAMEEQRRKSDELLRAALREKETLLKEVHHRVKNNMQVISSLLSLQMENITDARLLDTLNEAAGRIRAMALVHENLYQAETFSRISVDEYFTTLTAQLAQLLDYHGTDIEFEIQVADVAIAIDDAIPFGLIVTEILTNAIKYAFPDRRQGTVRISLAEDEAGRKRLRISDNGIGLPSDVDIAGTTTLGMRLIADLIEDHLEGSWQVERRRGVTWTVTWPDPPETGQNSAR